MRAILMGAVPLPLREVLIGLGQRHRGKGYRIFWEVAQRALGTASQATSTVEWKDAVWTYLTSVCSSGLLNRQLIGPMHWIQLTVTSLHSIQSLTTGNCLGNTPSP